MTTPTPTWQPISGADYYGKEWAARRHHDIEVLRSGTDGQILAVLEDFRYAAYPRALDAMTGRWERGGAYTGILTGDYDGARVQAKQWAERVAGLHPPHPEDDRPAFYYSPGDSP